MTIPVYIVNLDTDTERLQSVVSQVMDYEFLTLYKIPAFSGRTLPDVASHLLTGNAWSHEAKGALGCFLSHVKIWEAISENIEPFSVVIEDDIIFDNIEILEQLCLPPDAEIVFCNSRTSYPRENTDVPFGPIEPVVTFINEHKMSAGTDGYILTQNGAKKLLRFVENDKLFSHVDLKLLAYSMTPNITLDPSDFSGGAKTVLDFRRGLPSEHFIKGYSLYPAVVQQTHLQSVRTREDNAGTVKRGEMFRVLGPR